MNRRRGSVLLLSLMIMAVTLAVSLNLVVLINLGIGTSTVSKNALAVFYRAESGLERAMYRVRQLKVLPNDLHMGTDTNCDCGTQCPAIEGCSVLATYQKRLAQAITLKQDQSLEIDLIKTDGVGVNAGVDMLKIVWADVGGSPTGALVVTATLVAATNGWGVQEGQVTQEVAITPPFFNSKQCAGSSYCLNLSPNNSYIVNIRAVKSDVTINGVWALSNPGFSEKSLFDRLELTASAGNFISRQQLTVAMPGRVHASGLFPYVLYSECSLDKFPAGSSANSCP